MKLSFDLHIHTCLSPCAEDDMTPNNIVNMAMLKGLDIIAITDHNAVGNCASVMEVGRQRNILVVPGMELCTVDKIHLLCYFPDIIRALWFQNAVFKHLLPLKNREDVFGRQIYMDSLDHETGIEERLLSGACNLDTGAAIALVKDLDGAVVPAHIDRESFSMLYNLGTIPEEYALKYLECSKYCESEKFMYGKQALTRYDYLKSSDAHFLQDILERESFLDMEERGIKALISKLVGKAPE